MRCSLTVKATRLPWAHPSTLNIAPPAASVPASQPRLCSNLSMAASIPCASPRATQRVKLGAEPSGGRWSAGESSPRKWRVGAANRIQFFHMPVHSLEQKERAKAFLALHSAANPLILPNVWDVASARIVEEAGYPALATTSAGVAFSLGYADGEKIHPDHMMAAVARIGQAVKVPVSADVESGYGNDPENAARTARAVVVAGAIGLNLEDATGDPEQPLVDVSLQLEKLRAIRAVADEVGGPLVINARTDVYLLHVGESSGRYDETIRRLSAYRDAGADCVFAPGLSDAATIGRLVADLKCPVNILAGTGSPSVPELFKLGVARVSLGSAPIRAALGHLRRLAEELKTSGTYSALDGSPSYAEMNLLMERSKN